MTVIERYTEEFQEMADQLEFMRIRLADIKAEEEENYDLIPKEPKICMERIYSEIAIGNVGVAMDCIRDAIYEFAYKLHVCPAEQED